jgi:outer membrane protein
MAEELVKTGVKTESYLYDFKIQRAQDYYNLVQDKNNCQSKLIELIQLLELKSLEGFEIEKPDKSEALANKPDSMNTYFNLALAILPQVKSAQFRLQIAESNIEYTKGYRYPILSFKTSLNSGYASNSLLFDALGNKIDYPYNRQIKDNMNIYYGFSLTVPIFNRFQVRNSISTANYNKQKTGVNVELVQKKYIQMFKSHIMM